MLHRGASIDTLGFGRLARPRGGPLRRSARRWTPTGPARRAAAKYSARNGLPRPESPKTDRAVACQAADWTIAVAQGGEAPNGGSQSGGGTLAQLWTRDAGRRAGQAFQARASTDGPRPTGARLRRPVRGTPLLRTGAGAPGVGIDPGAGPARCGVPRGDLDGLVPDVGRRRGAGGRSRGVRRMCCSEA